MNLFRYGELISFSIARFREVRDYNYFSLVAWIDREVNLRSLATFLAKCLDWELRWRPPNL
jgi:hypothetical protein